MLVCGSRLTESLVNCTQEFQFSDILFFTFDHDEQLQSQCIFVNNNVGLFGFGPHLNTYELPDLLC